MRSHADDPSESRGYCDAAPSPLRRRNAIRSAPCLLRGLASAPASATAAGTPRIVKEWRRGTPLTAARTLFEGAVSDIGVGAYRQVGPRVPPRDWLYRAPSRSGNCLRIGDEQSIERGEALAGDVRVGHCSVGERRVLELRTGFGFFFARLKKPSVSDTFLARVMR